MWKFVLSGCLLTAAAAAAADSLYNIRTYEAPDHTRVVFDTSAATDARMFALSKPDRLVVDLRNTRPAASFNPDFSNVAGRRVKKVRMAERGRD